MRPKHITTIIGGAAFLYELHLTATSVLCYLTGALIAAAILIDQTP